MVRTDSRKLSPQKTMGSPETDNPGHAKAPVKHTVTGLKSGYSCKVSNAGVITYKLPKAGMVSLKLYDVSGRLHAK